jgi:hypothetical protein
MVEMGKQAGDFWNFESWNFIFWLYLPLLAFIGLDPFGDLLNLGSFGKNSVFRPEGV